MTPLDPGREEARRLVEEELSSGGYAVEESVLLRVWSWLTDLLPTPSLPGSLPTWANVAVLAVVLLAAVAVVSFAARDRRRRGSLTQRPPGAVLDDPGVTAAQLRARAAAALERDDPDTALLDAFRAVTAGAVERTLLDHRPGRTAHETVVDLTPVFPAQETQIRAAGQLFDAVRYGSAHASRPQAAEVLALDAALSTAAPTITTPAPTQAVR